MKRYKPNKEAYKLYCEAWRKVYADKRLTRSALAIMSILKDSNYERMYFSQSKIAGRAGVTRKTVNEAIKLLKSLGYLTVEKYDKKNLRLLDFIPELKFPTVTPEDQDAELSLHEDVTDRLHKRSSYNNDNHNIYKEKDFTNKKDNSNKSNFPLEDFSLTELERDGLWKEFPFLNDKEMKYEETRFKKWLIGHGVKIISKEQYKARFWSWMDNAKPKPVVSGFMDYDEAKRKGKLW